MKITNLRVNGLIDPVGYQMNHLAFTWRLEGANPVSQRFQLATDKNFECIIEDIEDVGEVNRVILQREILAPKEKYYWRVEVILEDEKLVKTAYFETAKINEAWDAKWISYQETAKESVTFSKQIELKKKIKSARLYTVAYGIYDLKVNGREASDEILLPGYQSYDLVNSYQTFDLTKEFQNESVHELEYLVGNGWYKGRFVFEGGYENLYGNKQKLIAELHLTYIDDSNEIILSDESWEVKTNEVQENSIYDGEVIDYSKEIETLTIDILEDGTNLLAERTNLPIKRMKTFRAISAIPVDEETYLIDFGQEITGWIEGKVFQPKEEVSFRFAELLQNGAIYTENLRTAKQEFILRFLPENNEYRPHFTFFGFRYVEVKGLTRDEVDQISAHSIYSEMEEIFTFKSSHKGLNKLMSNISWSARDNFLDIPTDCPQRDERMGWTGDVSVFSNAGSYIFDTRAFFDNYLELLRLEQKELGGSVPFFVPFPKVEPTEGTILFLILHGAAMWSDVATILPLTLYKHYKDIELLRKHVSIMQMWVDYIHQRDIANGGYHLWDFDQHLQLGDWLALDNGNSHNPIGATDPNLIASIYYYLSTRNLVTALRILNKESKEYEALLEDIRCAILTKYYDSTGKLQLETSTQTACALLLLYELYPNDLAREELQEKLAEELRKNNGFLNTGFVGTPALPHALSENGMVKEAMALLFNEEAPGWLFAVNQGATTIWERWDSIGSDGMISNTDMNSLNHYAFGSIADFIVEKLLGYQPQISLTNEIIISPLFTHQLDWIEGSFLTDNGAISISWRWIKNTQVEVKIDVPHQMKVIYQINGKRRKLSAGKHLFKEMVTIDY